MEKHTVLILLQIMQKIAALISDRAYFRTKNIIRDRNEFTKESILKIAGKVVDVLVLTADE